MTANNTDRQPERGHERTERQARLQEEMMVLGFTEIIEKRGADVEYANAYDAFLEEHGFSEEMVRDKPENVREALTGAIAGDENEQ